MNIIDLSTKAWTFKILVALKTCKLDEVNYFIDDFQIIFFYVSGSIVRMCSPNVAKYDACEVLNEETDWVGKCHKCNKNYCNSSSNLKASSFCLMLMYGWFCFFK